MNVEYGYTNHSSHCIEVQGHKYTCFARSVLCTGNLYDLYALVYNIVYIVFSVLNWLSNLKFWRLKKSCTSCANWGEVNVGNGWKKTFFTRELFPDLHWQEFFIFLIFFSFSFSGLTGCRPSHECYDWQHCVFHNMKSHSLPYSCNYHSMLFSE